MDRLLPGESAMATIQPVTPSPNPRRNNDVNHEETDHAHGPSEDFGQQSKVASAGPLQSSTFHRPDGRFGR